MKPISNRFTQVELNDTDEYMGAIFSDVQIAHLRNQLALTANAMLELTSPEKQLDERYFRLLEHYRGKMLAFEGLIQYSEALSEKMNMEIQEAVGKTRQFER